MATLPGTHHGHEVLEMMESAGDTYSRDQLIELMNIRFGMEARYHICSGSDMDAGTLVDVLMARGKFIGTPDAFRVVPGSRCDS